MFAGFNLALSSDSVLLQNYFDKGKSIFADQQAMVKNTLQPYINPDGSLSASKIEADWFPAIEANVFLSHSHADEDIVKAFAGYLYEEFEITCFIDSCVWGYANNLLKRIDNKYCKTEEHPDATFLYDYNKRNQSTSYVHLLLNGALAKMINSTECLIFINTPNSISMSDSTDNTKTASPWIYSELLLATTFPHKKLSCYRNNLMHSDSSSIKDSQFQVKYDVAVKKLKDLSISDFVDLPRPSVKVAEETLDRLYVKKGLLEKKGR